MSLSNLFLKFRKILVLYLGPWIKSLSANTTKYIPKCWEKSVKRKSNFSFIRVIKKLSLTNILIRWCRFSFSRKWLVFAAKYHTSQKIIHNSIKTFDNIWVKQNILESLWSPFVICRNKIELQFGRGTCWPSFCPNRVLEEQCLTVLPIFFQNYSIII